LPAARKLLEKGRRVFNLLGDAKPECEALLAESRLDLLTEDLPTAGNGFDAALKFAEGHGLNSCAAKASLGLALVKLFAGDITAYERLLAKSRELAEGEAETIAPDIQAAEAAKAYFADADYEAAYALACAAADEYRRGGAGSSYGEACLLAARAALARREPQSCREFVERPELARQARGSKAFAAAYNATAGTLFMAEGDDGRASRYLRAAAAAARELRLWLVAAETYLDLAALAGEKAVGESYLRRAAWLCESKGAGLLARRPAGIYAAR
jgi:hypothetical protein